MQFVKSSVYQAEITEGGVREREVDTRSREEVELQERLRRLPEFSRNPNFKSYAEQVWEGLPTTTPEPPPPTDGKQNPNLPHSVRQNVVTSRNKFGERDLKRREDFAGLLPLDCLQVTEEEFEFYEALRAQDRRKKLARQREEDAMRDEFHKAREASLKLSVGSAGSSGGEQRSTESDASSLASTGKQSPFAVLGTQKQRSRPNGHLESDGCIFDVTTKAFQEKQRKRAVDVSTCRAQGNHFYISLRCSFAGRCGLQWTHEYPIGHSEDACREVGVTGVTELCVTSLPAVLFAGSPAVQSHCQEA